MPGALSSSTTNNATGIASSLHNMALKQTFPCNTCNRVFENSLAQRTHMREPWHVYNLKRRIADLPPISADDYAENVATSLIQSKQERLDAASSSPVVRPAPKTELARDREHFKDVTSEQDRTLRCLFCIRPSDSLETNLEHMSSEHGLYIPDMEHLSSLETVIDYLRTVINEYSECLYCGMIKQSAEGTRRHMLDKGHCMINLDREPELLEFWEFSDEDEDDTDNEAVPKLRGHKTDMEIATDMSQDKHTLPSGKVITSKGKAREARLLARRMASATKETDSRMITENSTHNTGTISSHNATRSLVNLQTRTQGENQHRAVAVRDAAGLIGVSDQQMRSLTTVHRKMQRQQAIVRASASWADELGGTHQKHYKQKMNLRDG